MKRREFVQVSACLLAACVWGVAAQAETRTEKLRAKLESKDRNYVFVTMHRGDWRHAPENSSAAIEGAIKMGADIVELDVAKTKDGHYVLLHDGALDRVSNGKGKSTDLTLAEIKQYRLKDEKGQATEYPILSLEEAFAITKGRILVNLDKFNRDPAGITAFAKAQGVEREIVFKDGGTAESAKKRYGQLFWDDFRAGDIFFMPIVQMNAKNVMDVVKGWESCGAKVGAYEVCFSKEDPHEVFDYLQKTNHTGGPRIWVNTLWDSLCAGHTDERGHKGDAAGSWGWVLDQGATMIQTDRPADLIPYLEKLGRHSL